MPVICRMDDRQSLSMVAVCICAKLMLDLVCLEVCQTPHFQDPVLCHGGIPHQIAPCLIVINIPKKPSHVDYGISHDSQRNIIGYIILV